MIALLHYCGIALLRWREARRAIRKALITICVLFAVALNAHAAEFFVDGANGDDINKGSAKKPFKTISAALKVASPKGGDTITVKGGTYRESLHIGRFQATKKKPLVIQGARGERVIVTGFVPVTEWKEIENGVYTAEVPYFIQDFYVGLERQPVSRWPRGEAMRKLKGHDRDAQAFLAEDTIPETPELKEVAQAPMSARICYFLSRNGGFEFHPLVSIDFAGGRFGTKMERRRTDFNPTDRLDIVNHPALVKEPGDWAVVMHEPDEKGKQIGTLYFKPRSPEDLKNSQYQRERYVVSISSGLATVMSGVILRNLEITGAKQGISLNRYKDVAIENCIVHNNGDGITFRNGKGATLRNCVVVGNSGNGVTLISTQGVLVEGNEICHNGADGLHVAVSALSGVEPNTDDVTVQRNYIHHHVYMSQPENIQVSQGATNFKIRDNFLAFAKQNMRVERTGDSEMANNVSVCSTSNGANFGLKGENDYRWVVKSNTVGFSGTGVFAFTGGEYVISGNIFINSWLPVVVDMESDWNFFIPNSYASAVLLHKGRSYKSIEEATKETETDKNSIVFQGATNASPFKNIPKAYAVAESAISDETTTDTIAFGSRKGITAAPSDFAVGDNIEINGDGVMRKVTEVGKGGIKFEPALPRRPFRDVAILNWGKSESMKFDFTITDSASPVLKGGKGGSRIGSTLDAGEFYRGELLKKGKRTLPDIPADLKAAWPNPNNFVVPMRGL